jgi:hypothetical protein
MNKNSVNPCKSVSKKLHCELCALCGLYYIFSLWQKVEYTGCPITMLILQNKPNFPRFSLKIEDFVQKQSQNKPNSNPIKPNFNLGKMNNLANPVILLK